MRRVWRVLALRTFSAAENMAIDEAIGEAIAKKISPPTIRFYQWSPGAVSIGYFQCIGQEVDLDACRSQGIDYIRRRTGGGAVFHDPSGEITYSLIAPEGNFSGIRESYKEICSSIILGLSMLGISAAFRPINDVVVDGRKISGSAQTRRKGVLTQHGTILYKLNRKAMFSLLKPSPLKLSDKSVKSFEDSVTCVHELCGVSEERLYGALLAGFTENKEWSFGELSEEERSLTAKYVNKYTSDEWNLSR